MKICQVAPCFPYKEHLDGEKVEKGYHIGGVERHVFELSMALTDLGHSVTVLTTKSPSHRIYKEIEGIEILRVPYGISLYSSSIPFGIFRYFNPIKYDLIHAHTPNPTIADLTCFHNKGKVPFILTYHNDITKDGFHGKIISTLYNETLGSFLLTHSNMIIATTQNYVKMSVNLRPHRKKVKVIPNGTSLEKFSTIYNENFLVNRYNISPDSKVILFVGALEEYKGIDYLIAAFKKALDHEENCVLVIVGFGILFEKLRRFSEKKEISDKIIFAGYVRDDELPNYYASCNFFVLPSISEKEGFGIVQLEAMACGKPVICTNLPGVNEVDIDELASIHVPPKDVDSLANAMITMLENDDLVKKMGINGRMLVEDKYDWKKIAKMTEKIYNEVIL